MRLYKYVCVFMAIIVIAAATGCTKSGENRPLGETKISRQNFLKSKRMMEETYSIEIVTYHYQDIHVEYPRIQGLIDKEREEKINSLIEDHILLDIVQVDNLELMNELNMELECRITLQSQKLLSFYCVGESNVDGFKPYDEVHTMTLDIKEAKELKLGDFVDIDEFLVERIKRSEDVTNRGLEDDPDNEALREALLYLIQDRDTERYVEYLLKDWYGFVLEPDALVIEASVAYFAGNYVLVRLPGRIVYDRFIFDE